MAEPQNHRTGTTLEKCQIDILHDEVLLEIFDFYMNMYPHFIKPKPETEAWQSLVHVCRRWRALVFQSPRRLNLRLHCTPHTPVNDKLDIWPALPLVVAGMEPLGMDNVVAALGQNNRVFQATLLSLLDWQLETVLATMQVPFPELTILGLSSEDETPLIIPDSFLGGSAPQLLHLSLHKIPFPGLPNLLLSANRLQTLRLSMPHHAYFSPKAMVALISVLPSLRTFSLRCECPHWESQRQDMPRRSILPALDEFIFSGYIKYLEDLVARIDTPQLSKTQLTLCDRVDFDCPQLAQFVNRTPNLRICDEANLQHVPCLVIAFGAPNPSILIYIVNAEPDQWLPSVTQVCSYFFNLISTVEDLSIEHSYDDEYDIGVWKNVVFDNTQWIQLLLPFTTVENLYISKGFARGIADALQKLDGDRITEVLPNLQTIFVDEFEPLGTFQEIIAQFVAARQLSGHPITISLVVS